MNKWIIFVLVVLGGALIYFSVTQKSWIMSKVGMAEGVAASADQQAEAGDTSVEAQQKRISRTIAQQQAVSRQASQNAINSVNDAMNTAKTIEEINRINRMNQQMQQQKSGK